MNIVIIGASKGLGLCLTEKLLTKGYRVAVGTRSLTQELLNLKEIYQETLIIFDADITDEALILEGAKRCNRLFGSIDTICIVAGVLLDGDRNNLLQNCDLNDLRTTFEVNLFGPITVVKSFYPYLIQNANVFIVTSEGAEITNCGSWIPCYSLSKTSATKACGILNQSFESLNFYAVHPGRMNTDMGRSTAQIEPNESADGFCQLISGKTKISRDHWYIDYNGNTLF